MNAKEKAKELVNRIYQPLGYLSCNVSSGKMWEYAKERAKEFIADWLDTPIIWYDKDLSERNPEEAPVSGTEEYWQEVLAEIERL